MEPSEHQDEEQAVWEEAASKRICFLFTSHCNHCKNLEKKDKDYSTKI